MCGSLRGLIEALKVLLERPKAALKLQRDSGAAWGLLGAIRQRQGRFNEAVDACHTAWIEAFSSVFKVRWP